METHSMKSAPPVLRMGHLLAFTRILGKAGVPIERYLRSNGLPVTCNDPDYFVPLLRVWSFFDSIARHEDSTLGWRVGATVGDHGLNSGFLQKLETAPTLFQALQRLAQMVNMEASHIRIGIHVRQPHPGATANGLHRRATRLSGSGGAPH
jgi:hypothetical protein